MATADLLDTFERGDITRTELAVPIYAAKAAASRAAVRATAEIHALMGTRSAARGAMHARSHYTTRSIGSTKSWGATCSPVGTHRPGSINEPVEGDIIRDLVTLPKAHLHIHLEAAMRPATLEELAAKYSLPKPEIRGYGSFTAFSEMYVAAVAVLRERDDWERLADEVMIDHAADGAVYLEPSFGAINYRDRFATDRDCWEFVIDVFAGPSTS